MDRSSGDRALDGRPFPVFGEPPADFLYDPTLNDHLFLAIASQPIGDSTPEDWVAAADRRTMDARSTEPIAVDGATGLIGADDCNVAVVDDRLAAAT